MKFLIASVCLFASIALADGPVGPIIRQQVINSAIANDAQRRDELARKTKQEQEDALLKSMRANEWRVVNGVTNNLSHPDFIRFGGTVLSSTTGGILISSYSYPANIVRFIANYPTRVPDGTQVSGYAQLSGLYSYTAVSGAAANVQRLDYGKPCAPPQRSAQAIAVDRERAEQAAAMRENEALQRDARVVAFQIDKAENGYPSFQLELAKRYLTGNGVTMNTNLAIHWLQAACTNGESQASNLLRKIKL
jgi:hypothetical protein